MGDFGLVLGGGGAKGSYEIGVWKALRELEVPIGAVAGTSVGALNGAMIVQNDYELAYKLWTSLAIDNIVKVSKEVAAVNEVKKSPIDTFRAIKDVVDSRGLDTTPLRQMLCEFIDESKIRNSSIDFGIVIFSLTNLKPMKLFKNQIPEGQLIDYLLASACLPIFKTSEIENKKLIDGGVCDNIPVSLLSNLNFKNIITVDISGPGVVKKISKKGLNLIEIKNSSDLGGLMDFNNEKAISNIEMGYFDTLKAFGKIKGSKYYILMEGKESEKLERRNDDFEINDLKKIYTFLGMDWKGKIPGNKLIIDRIMRTIRQYSSGKLDSESFFLAMSEITAEQLQIDKSKPYKLKELNQLILEEYNNIKNSQDFSEYINGIRRLIQSRSQLEFDTEIKKTLIEAKFLISYDAYMEETDEKIKRFRRFVAMAFPKISIANMYITLILPKTMESQ